MNLSLNTTALIVVDVQKAFDEMEVAGAKRNNPDAVGNIALLLSSFRAAGATVIHIRHANADPKSRFNPAQPGHEVQPAACEMGNEPVLVKTVNSSFIGTDLDERLRKAGLTSLVIAGATTNHCVETTTRMAGNLGYDTHLVADATWTFDRTGPDGRVFPAQQVHDMSLANLHDEFCRIVSTGEVVDAMQLRASAD